MDDRNRTADVKRASLQARGASHRKTVGFRSLSEIAEVLIQRMQETMAANDNKPFPRKPGRQREE